MSLLADVRAGGFYPPQYARNRRLIRMWEEHARQLEPVFRGDDFPVFDIDDVAEYFFTGTDQEFWSFERDFKNITPPAPMCWMEYRMPERIHSAECGDFDVTKLCPAGRVGVLCLACDPKSIEGDDIPENIRSLVAIDLFIDYGSQIQGPHGIWFLALDEAGELIERPWLQTFIDPEQAWMVENLRSFIDPALLWMSLGRLKVE